MKRQFFRVVPFINPSGASVFRVTGFDGQRRRVRENYQRCDEAEAAADAYEVARINAAAGWQVVATSLREEQVRDAERATAALNGTLPSLSMAVAYALERWQPEVTPTLAAAARERYLAERRKEHAAGELSARQLRSISSETDRFARAHPGALHLLTQGQVLEYVQAGELRRKTRMNRRGILATWFRFCRLHRMMQLDPFADVRAPRAKRRRGTAPILTPIRAAEMMHWLETYEGGRAVPFFALCLFAGIRPDWRNGEIRRLRPHDVKTKQRVIEISPEVSKIDEARTITLRPNLAAWLAAYPLDRYPIKFANIGKVMPRIREHWKLEHDVLRHSFCTYVLEATGSLDSTARESGNSVAMIRNHYRGRAEAGWAKAFWAIRPARNAGQSKGESPRSKVGSG